MTVIITSLLCIFEYVNDQAILVEYIHLRVQLPGLYQPVGKMIFGIIQAAVATKNG